jgi:hypothetical protein
MATKAEEIKNGCLSKVAEDEPVFVLRAKDGLAPTVVKIWALIAKQAGVLDEKCVEAILLAEEMERWQERNGSKVPD